MDIFSTTRIFRIMEQGPDHKSSVFVRVLQGLLRPLVRALIAQGVTAPALYRIVKRTYVEVAETDFQLPGERQTDSRISMLTGVHRRDVKDFRGSDGSAAQAAGEKVTTIASVLGAWLANPAMRDGSGPLPLPRSGDNSFESLVQGVSKDIRPRTVLDELQRQGLVHVEDGKVHLQADAFLGPADPDQRVHFFAENVGDHIAAAVDNLLADQPQFMERAVFYNRLTQASIDEIEAASRSQGGELLIELNRMANERQAKDADDPEGTHRFRFGVFFYREDEGDGSEDLTGDGEKDNEKT